MVLPGGFDALRATLGETAFRHYTAGNSVSLVGNWMQRTAVGWLTWDLTQSATWLGIIAFADLFPAIIIGPIGGVLADRLSRRRIIVIVQTAMTLLAFLLFFLTALGSIDVYLLTAIVALHGVLVGINQPARLALIPALVTRDHLPTAIALNSVVFNLARFIGPAVAGGLIVTGGMAVTFFANALSYGPLIWVIGRIRLLEEDSHGKGGAFLHQLKEGLGFVAGHAAIGPLMLVFIAASILIRPLAELLPGFADAVFARGAAGLATLSAALGLGAVVGGLYLAQRVETGEDPILPKGLLGLVGVTTVFALSPYFGLAVIMIAVAGFCLILIGVSAQTMVQLHTPTELRGRVMSLYGLVARSSPAIGALILGALADLLGLRTGLLLGIAVFVLFWAGFHRRTGGLRRLLRGQDAAGRLDIDTGAGAS